MVGDRLGDLAVLFSSHTLPLQSEDAEIIPNHWKGEDLAISELL